MYRKLFSFGFLLGLPFLLFWGIAVNTTITAGPMICNYQFVKDSIEFELEAPTLGWIGIGFNDSNVLSGSDWIQLAVVQGEVIFADQYFNTDRMPIRDEYIGGCPNVLLLDGQELKARTIVRFKIPIDSNDTYDFKHLDGQSLWLILAYSLEDDFSHAYHLQKYQRVVWDSTR